ncbi:MAG: ADP-forming succinate--CoA ligase subunit beta, partial [Planctomycetota bacterium]
MKVHEYQARQLLHDAGIAVPPGAMVESVDDAAREAKRIFDSGAGLAVVKAQVHAGGRGKAGFVKLVKDAAAATDAANFMLSNRMKSPQTPPEGLEVNRLLVAEAVDIAKEFYVAILVDRARRTNTLIASAEGGVEIEKTAEERPEAILTMPTHPALGLQPFQAREVAFRLGFKGKAVGQAVDLMLRLDRLFRSSDASLAEINPLVLTPPCEGFPDGRVMAVDAKFSFDDNAMFRQKAIAALFDPAEENPLELKA